MDAKKLELLRRIKNGENAAYLELILNNDREQVVSEFKRANPTYYKVNEAEFKFDPAAALSKKLVSDWKKGEVIVPKFQFVPANNEWTECIERLKILK